MNDKYRKIRKFTEKWENVDKKSLAITTLVVLMVVVSLVLFAAHLSDITERYREVIGEKVEAQIENSAFLIISNTLRVTENVHGTAKIVAEIEENNTSEIEKVIRKTAEEISLATLAYVDVDGKVICVDKKKYADCDYSAYVEMYSGIDEFQMFDLNEDTADVTSGFVTIVPVRKENVISGYLVGVCAYRNIIEEQEIRSLVKHDEVIIDNDSNVALLIRDDEVVEVRNHYNFFDEVAAAISQNDFEELTNNYAESMNSFNAGTYVAKTGDEMIRYMYQPIPLANGWCIINCVPETAYAYLVNSLLLHSIIVFISIMVLLVAATLILILHIRGEQKRVSSLEYLDGLTGCMNRNAFTSRAQELLSVNHDLPYYIACYDIVNFRIINETYGHEKSDEVIKALANASKEAYGKNEAYGRLSADVFVSLVLNDGEEEERLAFIEEKVTEAARKVFINHPIKIKRGTYEVTNYMELVSRMIDKANIARKYAASDSKTFYCKYSDDLLEDARKSERIESQMEAALRNGEFVPYLQAKFDMEKNHVSGAEALVRWRKPDGSLVPPGDFIPLFEKNGFVEKIDFYMLEEICKYIRKMIDEGREVYPVSVNQSRYLLNDPAYVSKVKDILLKYEIPVGLIELELTETVFFHERTRMIDMMNDLKNIHVNLSIDDFGTGYSSFNLLKDVPFDVLKIDRTFLSDTEQSEKGRWILREIVEMAHGLGMNVICEGVETKEQIEMLLSINCKHAQGFYYARPIPMSEYIEKYNLIRA